MDPVTCPHCRAAIQTEAGPGVTRCPKCGVRPQFGITAKAPRRPASTRIAAGQPPSAQAAMEAPESVLDRLTDRLRRLRRINDYPGGGDDADCRRIGFVLSTCIMLPFAILALLLACFPLAMFVVLAHVDPATADFWQWLAFSAIAVGPPSVIAAMGWRWYNRPVPDDKDA